MIENLPIKTLSFIKSYEDERNYYGLWGVEDSGYKSRKHNPYIDIDEHT